VWRSTVGGRVTSTTGLTFTDSATTRGTTYDYAVKTYDGCRQPSPGMTVRVTA
jgi:hypothetical protein